MAKRRSRNRAHAANRQTRPSTADAVRREYEACAADYERRWRTFNRVVREWVLARWPSGLDPEARVLDIGCGTGAFLGAVAAQHPRLRLTGLELTPALLAEARLRAPGASLIEGDAEAPPLRAATFDVVTSLNVLHHLNDHEHHLAMLARLCRPRGSVFLCTFAGGRTLAMRAADAWLRRSNRAWLGMASTATITGLIAREARFIVRDRGQLRAGLWRLQIYFLSRSKVR